jgi:hypothetical protein
LSPAGDQRIDAQDPGCARNLTLTLTLTLALALALTLTLTLTLTPTPTPNPNPNQVEWLIELHDELGLPTEALLHGVHHVDHFLASQSVRKEALQLVGAVALMAACNSFCRLPTQDGERVEGERGLHSAEDIVYWTDNTYTTEEVLNPTPTPTPAPTPAPTLTLAASRLTMTS